MPSTPSGSYILSIITGESMYTEYVRVCQRIIEAVGAGAVVGGGVYR